MIPTDARPPRPPLPQRRAVRRRRGVGLTALVGLLSAALAPGTAAGAQAAPSAAPEAAGRGTVLSGVADPLSAPDQASLAMAANGHPRWRWPVAEPILVLNEFAAPAEAWTAGHRGIDLAAAPGDDVFAPAAGIVHFRGWVVDRPVLTVAHPGGYLSSFEPVESDLTTGDAVRLGDPIGVLGGQPGHCAGGCLHLGVRLDGVYVSPRLLLGGLEASVLLPVSG